jgi:hypothetical protein
MGALDKTAIVDYHLSFADQGKKTSVFQLEQTNRCFSQFSYCRKQMEVAAFYYFRFLFAKKWRHGDIEIETWKHRDIDVETWEHGEMEKWRHGEMETWRLET